MRFRRKILDTTREIIEREGFRGVTIARVAAESGVSRQTVYSTFTTREALVSQTMAEVALSAMEGLRATVAGIADPAEALIELFVAGRAVVRSEPALAALVRADEHHPFFDVGSMDAARGVVREVLVDLLPASASLGIDLDSVAEMAARIGLSVTLFDSTIIATDEGLRAFLRRWLLPGVRLGLTVDGALPPP